MMHASKRQKMAVMKLFHINGRSLTELFLLKLLLFWSLSWFGISQAENACRHGVFKEVKGECFITSSISSHRASSVSECSQRCVRVETCVGFKHHSTNNQELHINCEILKKIESCSQPENGINERSWKIYMPIAAKKLAICSKTVCRNGGSCLEYPCSNDGFKCTCRENFSGKFCEEVTGTFTSCNELHKLGSDLPNGAYNIRTWTDTGMSSKTYCQMTSLEGCAGGGWTMVMKVDGSQETFKYSSSYWSDKQTFNPIGGTSGFDNVETKLPTYWSIPFSEICIGMKVGNDLRFLTIPYAGHHSLHLLMADGVFRPIYHVARGEWKSLITNSSLQYKCNRVGFNNFVGPFFYTAARIGILANEDDSCSSPDSFLGIGGKYVIVNGCFPGDSTFPVSGNIASCHPDNGKVNIKSMGYILVR